MREKWWDEAMYYDGPLVLVASEGLEGWYTIRKGEHAGKMELRWHDDHGSLYDSGRVADACVEGPAEHMTGLATAIMEGGAQSFRRCAAEPYQDSYLLWSPRNSSVPGMVPVERATELARHILDTLSGRVER